jgi:hypothetical protein
LENIKKEKEKREMELKDPKEKMFEISMNFKKM